ncbi:metal-sensing transcriptional repressor [Ochrobactrum sp. WV_118_8]|uniref:Metal-sensing transcriptional repressor n=1 Tax=Stappia indica TaxID=538381 RepID=A0A857C8I1_9HYPH|nr:MULTISPECIES: metal-sensing transcriptional repressor [Hyphomicrobiales]QGZ35280.1 metal-sensing transcriptional repressor [Stappia indica]WKT92958.1 metal-sensing transcriptional repressor [Brucella anthropi]
MSDSSFVHTSHDAVVKRLRRADGHLRSVVEMIEAGRSCLDIAQQLHAVEKAISQAKKTLIQDHLDHCLEDVVGPIAKEQRRSIDEFKEITKYL